MTTLEIQFIIGFSVILIGFLVKYYLNIPDF